MNSCDLKTKMVTTQILQKSTTNSLYTFVFIFQIAELSYGIKPGNDHEIEFHE
jgi:hypothetical protein